MSKLTMPMLIVGLTLAGVGWSSHAAIASQSRKKPTHATAAPASAAAPSRANDLNSPSTDFSGVSPVIDDPKPDMINPKKKKDPVFD